MEMQEDLGFDTHLGVKHPLCFYSSDHIQTCNWVSENLCVYLCHHETETNRQPRAKDMARSDKCDAPSWPLCRPFIYTLLR